MHTRTAVWFIEDTAWTGDMALSSSLSRRGSAGISPAASTALATKTLGPYRRDDPYASEPEDIHNQQPSSSMQIHNYGTLLIKACVGVNPQLTKIDTSNDCITICVFPYSCCLETMTMRSSLQSRNAG